MIHACTGKHTPPATHMRLLALAHSQSASGLSQQWRTRTSCSCAVRRATHASSLRLRTSQQQISASRPPLLSVVPDHARELTRLVWPTSSRICLARPASQIWTFASDVPTCERGSVGRVGDGGERMVGG